MTSTCDETRVAMKLLEGDVIERMAALSADSVQLVVSSPPYGIGKSYEKSKTVDEYLTWMNAVVENLARVVSSSGAVCWQVGTHVSSDGEYIPLDILFFPLFKKHGFVLKNRIVWMFGSGLHSEKRLSGRYETVLWFVKNGGEYTFNLDPIRIQSKYPGKRAYKGPNKGELSGNPKGKNPSDVWDVMMDEWERGVWNFPNVKANHVEKDASHPCQFPVELAERCVLAFSNEGDTILDPFCGTGSTGVAACFHDRDFVGIDREAKYIQISSDRIDSALDGTLKTRKIGTPIVESNSSTRARQIPEEWKDVAQTGKKRIYEQYRGHE